MQDKYDVIIIGSGAAGAHSAYPLVKAGLKVAMIDGGVLPDYELEKDFSEDFESIRHSRDDQYKLFLGERLRGIAPKSEDEVHVISMVGDNREFVSRKTQRNLPINGKGVQVVQSLAKGGLSEVWAALCDFFSDKELQLAGIAHEEIDKNYQEVIDRIGVAGKQSGYKLLPPVEINQTAKKILDKYNKKNHSRGFELERSILAITTVPFNGREPFEYRDLEYAINPGRSIYKPRFTIEELEKEENFDYFPERIVGKITKDNQLRKILVSNFNGKDEIFKSEYVVLAAGSLNSTRILLNSFDLQNTKIPFITKSHYIIPCLHIKSLGKKDEKRRSSLTQLVFKDKVSDVKDRLFAQVISYKSFLLWRLAKFIPLPMPQAMKLLSLLAPSFVMLDVRFPSVGGDGNTTVHLNDTGEMVIESQNKVNKLHKKRLKVFKQEVRSLGVLPLKTLEHPFGSTAHYAGGVPVSTEDKYKLSVDRDSSLNQDKRIYVADSATWNFLPAKPPTLTIMANADRVGKNVLRNFTKR